MNIINNKKKIFEFMNFIYTSIRSILQKFIQ